MEKHKVWVFPSRVWLCEGQWICVITVPSYEREMVSYACRTYVSRKQSNINPWMVWWSQLQNCQGSWTAIPLLTMWGPQCSRLPVTCLSLVFIVSLCSPEPCLPVYLSFLIFCVFAQSWFDTLWRLCKRALLPVFGYLFFFIIFLFFFYLYNCNCLDEFPCLDVFWVFFALFLDTCAWFK